MLNTSVYGKRTPRRRDEGVERRLETADCEYKRTNVWGTNVGVFNGNQNENEDYKRLKIKSNNSGNKTTTERRKLIFFFWTRSHLLQSCCEYYLTKPVKNI